MKGLKGGRILFTRDRSQGSKTTYPRGKKGGLHVGKGCVRLTAPDGNYLQDHLNEAVRECAKD